MGDVAPQAKQIDPASLDAGAAIAAADRDAGWPASDWWRAYRDPQLDAWIAASLAGNPSLAAAQARVREAQSLARIAHAEELPQLNGSLSLMRQHWPDNVYYGPGPLANADTWNNTGALSLSYRLDLWGKDKNNARRTLDTARASAADARAAQLELEANVVRAYVDFAKDYALLDIAHATYDRQNELAELARKRLRAGIGTQLEVSQAEAPLPDYARQIDSYEEAIQLGRHQLAALAGKGPGAGAPLARPKLALDADASLPSALPAELIGRRPDVVAARWTVDAQARGIDVAKAAFYPNVDLIASLGGFAVSAPFATFLRAMNGGWSAGPALTLPIFEGGRLRAQLGVASAGYDEAVERYNQTIVGALKDIADNVVRLHSLDSQQKDAARAVALTRRSYDLSHTGFSRGLTNYVNVLLAQSQLLTAQENQARVEAARLAAHASLMIALGGGLETAGDAPHDAPAGDARRASAPNPPAASAAASASTKSGAPAAADAPAGSGASSSSSSSSSASASASASASSAGGRAAAASRASATAPAATASGLTAAVAGASAPTSAATSASATAAPAAR